MAAVLAVVYLYEYHRDAPAPPTPAEPTPAVPAPAAPDIPTPAPWAGAEEGFDDPDEPFDDPVEEAARLDRTADPVVNPSPGDGVPPPGPAAGSRKSSPADGGSAPP